MPPVTSIRRPSSQFATEFVDGLSQLYEKRSLQYGRAEYDEDAGLTYSNHTDPRIRVTLLSEPQTDPDSTIRYFQPENCRFLDICGPSFIRKSYELLDPQGWYEFLQFLSIDGFRSHLVAIQWFKEPSTPGHEYTICTFRHAGSSWSKFRIRLERDTGSWLTIFGRDPSAKNCRDKARISRDGQELVGKKDINIATLTTETSFITGLHLALLLRQLREHLPVYNILTYNCWWYAGSIWEHISYWVRQAGNGAILDVRVGESTARMAQEVVKEEVDKTAIGTHGWSATMFARNLQRNQLQVSERTLPNQRSMFGEVDKNSDEIRQYSRGRLHEDALQLAEELDVMNTLSYCTPQLIKSENHRSLEFKKVLESGPHKEFRWIVARVRGES